MVFFMINLQILDLINIKKRLFFLIYLDDILPKKIPENVIILYNKKKFDFRFFLKLF